MENAPDLDNELQLHNKKGKGSQYPELWARYVADLFADFGEHFLGFIPNGLATNYDVVLKRIPYVKNFFGHAWVEEALKFLLGITIGRGISKDLGRYCFWPIGFLVGLGISLFSEKQPKKRYEVGKILYQLSGQTVAGALVALIVLFLLKLTIFTISIPHVWLALGSGALLGVLSKSIMLITMDAVARANAASSRLNAKRATKLSQLLKEVLKEKAHHHIYYHARLIIEQIYGVQSEAQLQIFFAENHAMVCENTFKKIERHLSYLADRSIHGDLNALRKLIHLYRNKEERESALDSMLDRIVNPREIFIIKDKVDNLYDSWHYRNMREKLA